MHQVISLNNRQMSHSALLLALAHAGVQGVLTLDSDAPAPTVDEADLTRNLSAGPDSGISPRNQRRLTKKRKRNNHV